MEKKIVIMGVGNTLFRDEGVGGAVIEEIRASYEFDKNVKIIDGGIGGYSLISRIKDCDLLVLIDAIDVGIEPGSVTKYELDDSHVTGSQKILPESSRHLSSHQIGVMEVISISQIYYGHPKEVKIIGIQPVDMSLNMELTPEINAIIPRVVSLVLKELDAQGVMHSVKKIKTGI